MPWPRLVSIGIVVLLFALSLLGHRFNAALQASEMIFFVQKALEDLPPAELSQLAPAGPEVVTHQADEFRQQWQKFYEEHRES
jgi:hypothetical protein